MKKSKILECENFLKELKKSKTPFQIEFTTLTKTITYNDRKLFFVSEAIPMNELFFIKYFSDNLIKKNIPKKEIDYKSQIIWQFTEVLKFQKNTTIRDVFELDLNCAFWHFCKTNNFISDEVYKRGFKVSKITRLAAIGATAKKLHNYYFNGNEYEYINTIDSDLKNVFFKVAYDCSIVMQELAYILENDFLFFWVDGIFFKNENSLKNLTQFLIKNKLPFKVKKNLTLRINKKTATIFEKNKKNRTYYLTNTEKNKLI